MEILYKILEHSVHILTILTIVLLARLIPANKSSYYNTDFSEFISNPKKEAKWGGLVLLYIFIIIPTVAYPIGVLIEKIDVFIQESIWTKKIWFLPSFIAYYIIALCLMYMLACVPSRVFLKEVLKRNYDEYLKYLAFSEYKHGISNRKASIVFFVFFFIVLLGLMFVLEKTKTSVYDNHIEFAEWENWKSKKYFLGEIQKIEFAKTVRYDEVRTENEDFLKITFKNQDDWNSLNYDFNDSFRTKIKYISDFSRIKIDTLETLSLE